MKIAYLKLTNFMLYKKFNRKFKDKNIIGIICEYKDNENKSNRGGKTTIMEAVKYVLHGNTRAKKEVKLIHNGEDYMEVELGLIDRKGKTYTIRRGREKTESGKDRGILECDWVDKKRDAQEAINKLIGCDGKEFELINYFKQSDINKFLFLPEKEQKQHLMKWLDNAHWNPLFKAVEIDRKDKTKELTKKKTKRDTILESLGDPVKLKNRIKKTNRKIKEEEKEINLLIKKKDKLNKKYKTSDELETIKEKKNSIEIEIESINEQIESIKKAKINREEFKESKKGLKKEVKKFGGWTQEGHNQTIKALSEAEHERSGLMQKLSMVEKEFCGICPILDEGCDRIKPDKKQIKKWKKVIKKLDAVCQASESELERIEQMKALGTTLLSVQNAIWRLDTLVHPVKPMKKKLVGLEDEYDRLKQQLKDGKNKDISKKKDRVKNQLKLHKKGLDELNQKLGQYQSRITQIEKANKKVSKIDKSIKKLEVEVEDLKYLAFMFGKSGIPSQEIENAFGEIEGDINLILRKMGTTFEIFFNADKEIGDKEGVCVGCGWVYPKSTRKKSCDECGEPRRNKRKEALSLIVKENGYDSDVELDSGGGLTMISFALRMALTMLKKRQRESQLDVIFLDEPDSALDEANKQVFMDLVTKVLKIYCKTEQIFWVTHDKRIQNLIPHTLKVIRYEDYSKAVWI